MFVMAEEVEMEVAATGQDLVGFVFGLPIKNLTYTICT